MPFTVSHVAAVLPFRRSRLSFAALAIGSMSLDFSYILATFGPLFEVHNIFGIFIFGLPVTLVIWWLYQNYLQPAWVQVFPWLLPTSEETPIWVVALSALIGASTHLLWDGFTHRYGWPVVHWPDVFQAPVLAVGSYQRPLFGWLQHLSSVAGAAALAMSLWVYLKTSRTKFVGSRKQLGAIGLAIVILSLIFNIRFLKMGLAVFESARFEINLVQFVFRVLAAIIVVIAAFPAALYVRGK